VAEKKLTDKFHFLGFRPDVPTLIADFDIFLFTSKTEGLGTSILDAFAAGIPTVATNAGGIPEIIVNNKTGLLCPVKDPKKLAQAVENLLSNELLAEKLVAGAKEKLAVFSLESLGNRTYEQYMLALH
jgi:glycosyltransferase involved in cell wall biosynthesis